MDAFELQQEERKICQHIKKSFDKEWSKLSSFITKNLTVRL
jgi:hypothetical protein